MDGIETDVPVFAGNPLARAAGLRREESRLAALEGADETRWLVLVDLAAPVRDEGTARLAWLPPDAVEELRRAGAEKVFLGTDGRGDARFALAPIDDDGTRAAAVAVRAAGAEPRETRAAAAALGGGDAAIVAEARSLLAWHLTHRFCARCGGPTRPREGGWSRGCAACGSSHFPRTDPVVIMLVHRTDRILLGRSRRPRPYPPGLVSCLAGYVEPGETLEEAVRREVAEEAGIRIGHVRYHSSQPWPFPSTLMVGCFAEALDDRIRLELEEVEEATWYGRGEAAAALRRWDRETGPRLPPPFTIAHRLVRAWLDGEAPALTRAYSKC